MLLYFTSAAGMSDNTATASDVSQYTVNIMYKFHLSYSYSRANRTPGNHCNPGCDSL